MGAFEERDVRLVDTHADMLRDHRVVTKAEDAWTGVID